MIPVSACGIGFATVQSDPRSFENWATVNAPRGISVSFTSDNVPGEPRNRSVRLASQIEREVVGAAGLQIAG